MIYRFLKLKMKSVNSVKEGKIGANEYGEDPKAEERIVQPFSEQIVEENNVNR